MNVVPAQVAGVSEIALASPPQRAHGGRVHPVILAAARLLGVDEVYAMGGAGAIGAFAYGVAEPRARPGRCGHRTGQQLRRGGQARRRRRRGNGCRGRRHRDPHRRRRHRRPASGRRRPHQPGRARRAGLRGAGHGIRGSRRARSPPKSRRAPRAHDTPSASPRPSQGRSRRSCWSTILPRRRRSATPTPPSTSSCTSPTRTRTRSSTPARSSSARTRR